MTATESSRSGRSKRGNLESCGGKNVRARLEPFHLNWPEPVRLFFGQPERANGKPPKCTEKKIVPSVNDLLAARERESLAWDVKHVQGNLGKEAVGIVILFSTASFLCACFNCLDTTYVSTNPSAGDMNCRLTKDRNWLVEWCPWSRFLVWQQLRHPQLATLKTEK